MNNLNKFDLFFFCVLKATLYKNKISVKKLLTTFNNIYMVTLLLFLNKNKRRIFKYFSG